MAAQCTCEGKLQLTQLQSGPGYTFKAVFFIWSANERQPVEIKGTQQKTSPSGFMSETTTVLTSFPLMSLIFLTKK